MGIIKLLAWLVIINLLLRINGKWFCNGCLKEERRALLHIKDSMHLKDSSLYTWMDNEASSDCCQWPRVQCSNITKRVINIDLSFVRGEWLPRNWYFNASLFLPFNELRNLSLRSNYFEEWVENEGFEKLSMLKNLEALDLSYNPFISCKILSSLWLSSLKYLSLHSIFWNPVSCGSDRLTGLHKLEVLDLGKNYEAFYYVGDVSSVLKLNDFINLRELDISENDFQSIGIPCRLRNLKTLNMAANYFTNDIFFSLQRLSSLEYLNLRENKIEGSVQLNELHALTNLVELDLSYNQFENLNTSGVKSMYSLQVLHLDGIAISNISDVLQSLSAFPYLKDLYLQGNNLNRTIEAYDQLKHLSQLEELSLSGSHVDVNFLEGIRVMTSLKYLSLSDCSLNESLWTPAGLCELTNLEELSLSDNDIDGTLPTCLENLTRLRLIDLFGNKFTGNIGFSPLSKLTSLEYLDLSNNEFQIPISLKPFFNHSNLRYLLAKGNKFIAESEEQKGVPRFQLKVLMHSGCQDHQKIPNFLRYQSGLVILDLSYENFVGSFPTWLLENNTKLVGVRLNNNVFEGPLQLPSSVHFNIMVFDISRNNLNGWIPTNLSTVFPNLVLLDLSHNAIHGSIPSSLGVLKALMLLDLSSNNLSGKLPQELSLGCFNLQILRLSDNKLQGELFSGATDISALTALYLGGNEFSGSIPDTFFSTSLNAVNISDNHLSGKIPKSVGNSKSVAQIVMSRNQLEGPISEEFCKLSVLHLLDLSENNLSGSIPSCFNSTRIGHIYLSNNYLEGQLAYSFYNCSDLVTLDLRGNELSGSIPQYSIGNLSSLSVILLGANYFEGRIPDQLCGMTKLSIIDLSFNKFSGHIPRCLGNISLVVRDKSRAYQQSYFFLDLYDLSILYGRSYHLSLPLPIAVRQDEVIMQVTTVFVTKRSSLPYTGNILNRMSGIDLSSNNLNGEIPDELGKLREIRALNLSHNNFTGKIPESFSNMYQIESLDLSYNNLDGSIPAQFSMLNFLVVFSVAHNNLTGQIPQNGQFSTFDESDFEGNPFLCGKPLHVDCSSTGSPLGPSASTYNETEESGFLDRESFYISFSVSYMCAVLAFVAVLLINPYWRRALFDFVELLVFSIKDMF